MIDRAPRSHLRMHRFSFSRVVLPSGSRPIRGVLLLGVAFALISACSADKNYEQRQKAWEEQQAAAQKAGGSLPPPAVTKSGQGEWVTSVGDIHNPPTCIRNCVPDPPPPPVKCAEIESKYEFFPGPAISASGLYTYDDYSAAHPTRQDPTMPRCITPDAPNGKMESVVRYFGGPYQSWGGGIGRSMRDYLGSNAQRCTGPGTPAPCESIDVALGAPGQTIDLSQWDGVSLWARRGPESQAGFRVTVGDPTTDDDLNIDQTTGTHGTTDDGIDEEQRWCKRVRRCDCSGPTPCTHYVGALGEGDWCFDPKYQDPPTSQGDYPRCGQTACNEDYEGGAVQGPPSSRSPKDPRFNDRTCTPFQLQSGYTRAFCFDPGQDPDPAEASELCGDHFQTPVHLSTEWQFITVPFSGMRQQAYGKESPGLSTDRISIVRLTFEGGWIDFYIADMRFYRVKR